MEFDIQYLLFLQELRNATGGMFDEFFNAISKVAVDVLIFLPYILFWSVSKRWGYRFIATLWSGDLINGLVKLTACAYRPWIRSSQIEPAGDSKVAATGYSFPSGHTMCATTMYGSTAVWQHRRRRWVSVVCIVLILLTGFSRNFLGVHTPQDVVVGLCESLIIIALVGWVGKKLEGNEKLADRLTLAGVALVIASLLYITLKPYPMDYVDGVLLVDPQRMMNDTFKACGGFFGLLAGSYVERHYIHYEIPAGNPRLPVLACVGAGIMFSWKEYFAGATLVAAFGGHWGNFLSMFVMVLFGLVLYPIILMKGTAGGSKNARKK